MNERHFVEKIQEAVRAEPSMKGAVIFKHAETLTAGIPDISVTLGGTSWLEVKYQRAGEKLIDICRELQIVTCHQLAQVNGGRAWVAVYEDLPRAISRGPKRGLLTIWKPSFLHAWLYRPNQKLEAPVLMPSAIASPLQWVAARGAVYVEGHQHQLIARLLREAAEGAY